MRCPGCQHENREGRRFCSECGASLAFLCAACGFSNEPGEKFCGGCGQPLLSSAQQSTPKSVSPVAYTPKHLAEKILTSKVALEGERKQVTVLFADLKGSMELLADRDPEEARKLLDPVLERMMEAVHRYEGTVNQVMGDGIKALFGAPIAHEDHAVRACYAALRMQDAVRRYSDELRRGRGVEVQIRVGVNSGDVVVRSIGSDLRMDYTAVGQTTHLAARMEQLAAPGSIRLTAETLHLAEGFVQVIPLGPVPIKGLAEPIEVFELLGAGAARTRLEAAARRGLIALRRPHRRAGPAPGRPRPGEPGARPGGRRGRGAGRGQVASLLGVPSLARVHGWLVVLAASVSYGKATAYLPVIELLRSYFEIESRDDPRKIREKVTGKVLTLAPALGSAVPALLALLDVPVDEASWQALDPLQRRQQTLDALKRLLLHESEVQPLIVVFEDLHWIDGETQALLDGLVESLPAARLLLLVNYRPEYQHTWGGKTYYRQLRIDPLPPESADELLEALLGADAALGPRKQLLVERTEANPLFLEESVRALVETAALAGERGAYRLTRPVETLKIPATVQAILAARIDRLAPEAKRLLQAAAVIGKDVPMPLLLAIADAPEPEVRAELTHLQAAEFLYETRLFPDLEYTFEHALTHDVAYGGLLHDQQRPLHARIAEAIERLAPDRVAEQAERLAHHALRGELWEKAVAYLRQAGLRAMARAANREAIAHLEQGLGALRRLPETRETTELTIDIRLDLRTALSPLGDRARMGEHLHEAEVLARTLGDQYRLARIATFMVFQCLVTGDYDEPSDSGRKPSLLRAPSAIARSRWWPRPFWAGRTPPAASSATRPPSSSGTSRSKVTGATSASGQPSSSRRCQVPGSPTCSPSSAGSTRPSRTPKPPCRSPRRPIIPGRCSTSCSISASPTYVAGISRGRPESSSDASTSAERGSSSSGHRSSPRPSAPPTPSPAGLTRRSRWRQAPSRSSAVARGTPGRRSFFCARGRPTSRPDGSTRPPATQERHWRSPAGWGRAQARLRLSASSVTSRRQAAPRTPNATTARRWRSPPTSACVPSSRTVTSASASSIAARESASRRRSTSPARQRCTARWT
jgi:class 3 adenylate cyclase